MKAIWTDFDHQIKSQLEKQIAKHKSLFGKSLLVAVSGGADSVANFCVLQRLSKYFNFKISVLHAHHGFSKNATILDFRDKALQFTQELAKKYDAPFFYKKYEGEPLMSEEDFRNFRHQVFREYIDAQKTDYVTTGHQANDLLETRFMRLVRGTGSQGLQGMNFIDGHLLRPLLFMERKQILQYLEQIGQDFLVDPSNLDTQFFRNWIRLEWLASLEKKRPGSTEAFSRSLQLIVEALESQEDLPSDLWLNEGLARSIFLSLTPYQQRAALAKYLLNLGMRDFKQSHIEEIKKHLDISQITHRFTVARHEWFVNAERILAKPTKSTESKE